MNEMMAGVVNFTIEQVLENGSYFPFILIMLMMTVVVVVAHFNKAVVAFSFYDTLITDGHASLEKIAAMLGYITLTWWFVDGCAKGKVGAAEATAYGAIVITARLGSKYLDRKSNDTGKDS